MDVRKVPTETRCRPWFPMYGLSLSAEHNSAGNTGEAMIGTKVSHAGAG
jgi:hypothetical protein